MLMPWARSLRFRFGTWRRNLLRRRVPPRRLLERRRSEDVTVSVVVPVKNAGPDLRQLITQMKAQRGFRAVEVVIVDSGSTDASVATAEELGATLVVIRPEQFSHSYARNLGAERASGDYLLFTVQDALPGSQRWLQEMFCGLRRHRAAAVSCGEQPRGDADLFYRAISWQHHRFMSPNGRDALLFRWADESPLETRRNAQISDVACLVGRELFLRYRHRGDYAEDLDLGLRLTADGYPLAFLASTRIVHSHRRPAHYHLKRSYVEHLALFDLLPGFPAPRGELDAVASDVAGSCAALDALVHGPLRQLSLPMLPRALHAAVKEGLGLASHAAGGAGVRDYLDERTRDIVRRLGARGRRPLPRAGAAEPGSLTDGLAGVAGLFCAYLEDRRQALDADTLEDFKEALYKGWAQHCGVRLAAVHRHGPQEPPEAMRSLHEELARDV